MKTILITAYAVNPFKGSEDGMGWNYIVQAAREHKVIAVTRRNNRRNIDAQVKTDPALYSNISFLYYDWPQWMITWKKGPMLSMIYYYLWQISLVVWIARKKLVFDLVHNLNFHNDWTPSFLWLLGKPFVWGPVGHHPRIPEAYIRPYGLKERIKDRVLWAMKNCFWKADPFLKLAARKAGNIWYMHSSSMEKLSQSDRFFLHPSIAASSVNGNSRWRGERFDVLSVGRFVPLKGFDVTILAFARFYNNLPPEERPNVSLTIVGKGPGKAFLQRLIMESGVAAAVNMVEWMSQPELNSLYENCDAFIYPSHEGAGMVVAEAMRYGVPVLCWNNEGPGNIVHPESSLKIEYAPYEQGIGRFADVLDTLRTDTIFYTKESRLARERFNESLSWDVKAAQLKAFYSLT